MSTAPVVGVLALQGDVREHVAMLERAGATAVTVRRPAELDRVDGLVMPGGESTTMDKLARDLRAVRAAARAARAAGCRRSAPAPG